MRISNALIDTLVSRPETCSKLPSLEVIQPDAFMVRRIRIACGLKSGRLGKFFTLDEAAQ